jgi:hypothetical protein
MHACTLTILELSLPNFEAVDIQYVAMCNRLVQLFVDIQPKAATGDVVVSLQALRGPQY